MEISKWEREIKMEREQKDVFFAEHFQSPIPFEDRNKFKGLDYYPPNPDYCFELELHEHSQKKKLEIEDTIGNVRNLIRWGEFRFNVGNEEYKIQAYKANPSEERLFIPFRDVTSGKQTYGAGRYLDLNPEEHITSEGKWILDFNRAYNPWCAYSKNYVCPFVPPENWLKVYIPAGEKKYSLKEEA
jgi:uncharacterized protein (DUF1684 family)